MAWLAVIVTPWVVVVIAAALVPTLSWMVSPRRRAQRNVGVALLYLIGPIQEVGSRLALAPRVIFA